MNKYKAKIGKYLTRNGVEDFYQQNLTNVTGKILDVGAGTLDKSYCEDAKITRLDIRKTPVIDIVADIHDLPIANNEYDIVIAKEVLEHLYDPNKAVSEIKRVLKPEGIFIASTCFYWPIHAAPIDYFRFTYFGLKKLLSDWKECEIVPRNGLFGMLGIHLVNLAGSRRILLKLLYPLIIVLSYVLIKFDMLFKNRRKDISITSGYYIIAKK